MKIIRLSLWTLSSTALFIMLFAWYGGFFETVDIRQQTVKPFNIAYRYFEGKPNAMREITDELIMDLSAENIDVYKTLFIIEQEKGSKSIKALVGCIIEKKYLDRMPYLKQKFSINKVTPSVCIVGSMIYENWLNIYAAEWRIRPVLESMGEKLRMQPFEIIEIRNSSAGQISYLLVESSSVPGLTAFM